MPTVWCVIHLLLAYKMVIIQHTGYISFWLHKTTSAAAEAAISETPTTSDQNQKAVWLSTKLQTNGNVSWTLLIVSKGEHKERKKMTRKRKGTEMHFRHTQTSSYLHCILVSMCLFHFMKWSNATEVEDEMRASERVSRSRF